MVALSSIVQRSLQEFEPNLQRGQFTVTVDVPADLPLVRADPNALGLLLNNLIDNAIRYSRETRVLTITARSSDGRVILEVIDRGIGIAEDELARVTRKFFRGRGSVAGGSGLGLAIVDRIVADHGGTLSIRSRTGQGTTVSITIPAVRS
jgi:signal transduction histidine kinase